MNKSFQLQPTANGEYSDIVIPLARVLKICPLNLIKALNGGNSIKALYITERRKIDNFSKEELQKLMDYANFLISKRKE